MATAPPTEPQQNVQRGLEYLKSSDQIIGDIVTYCINAYKADPQPKTLERIRQYVQDTANSVSEHILNIAHNLSKMLEQETKDIEQLSYDAGFVSHRLQISQSYMCELFMTKFQVCPRPRKTVHMMRKTIPEDQLPKQSRVKRWVREKAFDYTVLDGISDEKPIAHDKSKTTLTEDPRYTTSPSASGPVGFAPPMMSSPLLDISSPKTQPATSTVPELPTLPAIVKSKNPVPPAVPAVNPSGPMVPPPLPSSPSSPPVVPPLPKSNASPPVPPLPNASGPPVPPPQPASSASAEPPEDLKPFLKMLKVGVPRSAVQNKMTQAGLDPSMLDAYVDGGSKPPVADTSPVSRPPNPMAAAIKARNAQASPQPSGGGGPPIPPPVPRPNI